MNLSIRFEVLGQVLAFNAYPASNVDPDDDDDSPPVPNGQQTWSENQIGFVAPAGWPEEDRRRSTQ